MGSHLFYGGSKILNGSLILSSEYNGSNAQLQEDVYLQLTRPSSNGGYSGFVEQYYRRTGSTASTGVISGMGQNFEFVDARADTPGVIAQGISLTSTVTANGLFLMEGYYRNTSWSWSVASPYDTPILYLGLTGGITDDVSSYSTGDAVQRVGWAVSSDIIYWKPSLTQLILA
jgi:hypothetical protein